MEKVNLPIEHASEPNEEAHQPSAEKMGPMKSNTDQGSKNKPNIHFTVPETNDQNYSQNSSKTYKEALSQPASTLSHKERLLWLQRRRGCGLWAQCDRCARWRYLPQVLDSHELPEKWFCNMNTDASMADCSIPEARLKVGDEEELIHNEYSCGSLVWARTTGWPAWPAMVDDEPDTEQFYWLDGFSDIPTHYNVVFFDSEITRAWISPENLKPYNAGKKIVINDKKNRKRIDVAIKQANDAAKLSVEDRLAKYSFIARYKGPVCSPIKVDRKVLQKFQKKLQKKFNVDFPIESSSDSDDDYIGNARKTANIESHNSINKDNEFIDIERSKSHKRKNVIIVGTPKRSKNITQRNILKDNLEETSNFDDNFDEALEIVAQATKNNAVEVDTNINSDTFNEPDSVITKICDSQDISSMIATGESGVTVLNIVTTMIPDTQDTDARPLTPNSDDFDF